jgi:hypothetical protein
MNREARMVPVKPLENLNDGKGLKPNAAMLIEILMVLMGLQQRRSNQGKICIRRDRGCLRSARRTAPLRFGDHVENDARSISSDAQKV